jgi:hypothetical protein
MSVLERSRLGAPKAAVLLARRKFGHDLGPFGDRLPIQLKTGRFRSERFALRDVCWRTERGIDPNSLTAVIENACCYLQSSPVDQKRAISLPRSYVQRTRPRRSISILASEVGGRA